MAAWSVALGTVLALLALHDAYLLARHGSSRGLDYYFGLRADGPEADIGEFGGRVLLSADGLSQGLVLAQLQRHPEAGALPVLRLETSAVKGFDDADLEAVLRLFSRTLARRQPFVVMWDVRKLSWPRISKSQYARVRSWVGEHVIAWDTYAQAHVILIHNPLARALVSIVLRIFRPPQPHQLVRRPAEAWRFAATCSTRPRSWVKDSYDDRDNRYSMFGSLGLRVT